MGESFIAANLMKLRLVDEMEEEIELRKQMNVAELNDLDEIT
ncbi:hypothetical protein WN944_016048 [Citrus x changshan-huyou]|uniref:Uncharacterized protein n=1 Tax=Citrus x changshan-huyou TaxID=2935761 RepID=A0AAP0MA56_9ROSI